MGETTVADADVASADTGMLLVSHAGHVLSRNRAFRFAADPTLAQSSEFIMCAGARRYMFNHHIGRVKQNLDVRRTEAAAGFDPDKMTGSLSWSKVSFINECNAWKNGQLDTSPVNDDGTRGLAWRHQVPADVFECASADAAQALANFSNSVRGVRKGKKAGFARFKSKHHSTPSFGCVPGRSLAPSRRSGSPGRILCVSGGSARSVSMVAPVSCVG